MDNNIISSQIFKNNIYINVIGVIFPSLISQHANLLLDYLIKILLFIQVQFCISDDELYVKQICQLNYKDIKGILFMLLPYINNENDIKKIKSLNDIYIKKSKNININLEQPKYLYSNLQYNRCTRNKTNIMEIQFSPDHLEHNYKLLIETIKTISNKLCVNWLNIVPYDMKTFMQSDLYKNTYDNINHGNYAETTNNSLYIGDIYNVCANDFYHNVKNIKWLFFNYSENTKKTNYNEGIFYDYSYIINNQYPLIIILNKLLPLKECYNNVNWEELDILTQILFKQKLEYLKKIDNITLSDIILTKSNIDEILKSMYKCYAKKYNIEEYKINTLEKFNNLNCETVYNIIKESINEMKFTWFGHYLFDFDNQCIKNNKEDTLFYNIPIKYIYNFSKSLCHAFEKNEKEKLSPFWSSLDKKTQKNIIDKLNNKNDNWFNVTRIIQYTCNVDRELSLKINEFVYNRIRELLIISIFENLILKGILTKIEPHIKYSDIELKENLLLKNYLVNMRINNINMLKYSYHYLTNKTYEKMENYVWETLTQNNWHMRYTFDWITQINVFHHFINNRIIYLTGTTGIGKSTQIPKLFLYALKMIQYNNNGKIIITVPRIKPLKESAYFVAKELGVPIDDNKNNIYNVQYKYKDSDLIYSSDKYGLILRFVTDGIFLNDIINNMDLKKKINDKVTSQNLYDVVMIDESHEHNTNMDIILSLMKFSLYNNNKIKLIISSATMDNDECTYRRFYRDINDNVMFPFSMFIKENDIDRINIDRRLHIEQPDIKYPYFVTEIPYNTLNNENNIMNIIMNVIMEIIKKKPLGDILLFQIGQKEITSIILHINNNTPPDTIAIPLYSKLEEDANKIMMEFNNYRKLINISKTENFNGISIEKMKQKKNFTPYKRFIIVATNIAEASITIPSIKYVIDTGEQKVSKYDYKSDKTLLITTKISNVSRIQRKGRVGRKSEGTIYYLYDVNKLNNEPIICNIMIEDISINLFNLLNSKNEIELTNDDFNYIGNYNHYDYNNTEDINEIYKNGIEKLTLDDKEGIFYIIHPDENFFIRNISGNIVKKDSICINSNNESLKINFLWNKLINYGLINDMFNKTEFGLYVSEYIEIFDIPNIDIKHIISYIYSKKYKCSDIFIKLIALLGVLNNKLNILYGLYPYYNMKNNYGDIKILLDIIVLIDKFDLKILKNNEYLLNQICNKNNLNYILILNYINICIDSIPNILNKIKNIDEKYYVFFKKFCNLGISKLNIYENVTLSLCHGFFNNIVYRYDKYPTVINVLQPYIENIYILPQYKNHFLTSLNESLINDYLLYLGYNETSNTISIILKINKNILNQLKNILKLEYSRFIKTNANSNVNYNEEYRQIVKSSYHKILNNILYSLNNC